MERREPIEEEQPEPEPQPQTASAGGVRPPGRIGGGLRDNEGGDEPPPRGGHLDYEGEAETPQRRGGTPWSNPHVFHMPVEDLNLSTTAYVSLRKSGLMTVGQVLEKRAEELLSLRNFGRGQYQELRERLDRYRIFPASRPWGLRRKRWMKSDFKYERLRMLNELL